jgi:hypothetical protein
MGVDPTQGVALECLPAMAGVCHALSGQRQTLNLTRSA